MYLVESVLSIEWLLSHAHGSGTLDPEMSIKNYVSELRKVINMRYPRSNVHIVQDPEHGTMRVTVSSDHPLRNLQDVCETVAMVYITWAHYYPVK